MNSRIVLCISWGIVVVALFGLSASAGYSEEPPRADAPRFTQVLAPQPFQFPRDHGAHPDYATEWWYTTGHLAAAEKTYGFELVVFRVGVDPRAPRRSAWAAPSLYLAHAALTDDRANRFAHDERHSRGSFGSAGASETGLDAWVGDWRIAGDERELKIHFQIDGEDVALTLQATKPLVLHGNQGFSKKGAGPGEASFYTSFTRLTGRGVIRSDRETPVTVSAWYDHEVTSSDAARNTLGWDWFAVQLENGEEVMLYQLRDSSGQPNEFSSGTFVAKDGSAEHLRKEDFSIEVLDRWKSPHTGAMYPARWRVKVPAKRLVIEVRPTVADQELDGGESAGRSYWEGRTVVVGERDGGAVNGAAYVELVGYSSADHPNHPH